MAKIVNFYPVGIQTFSNIREGDYLYDTIRPGESQREALSDYLLSDVQFPQHLYPHRGEECHRQG